MSVFDPIPLQGALSNSMPRSNKVQDYFPHLLQTPILGKLRNFQYQFLNSYFHLLPSIASLDSKITELQYKVLNRILYANTAFFKMRIFDSHLCTFCQISKESLEHLFIHCPMSSAFWLSVVVTLGKLLSCISRFDRFEHIVWLFGKKCNQLTILYYKVNKLSSNADILTSLRLIEIL